MWKRFAVAAMACIIITTHPVAQIIQPLSVGDTVSSEKVFPLLNDKDSLFNLSQSKDELLLLDFWATWCTSCIAKFPKLDSLQQEFTGKLKILLVNWDEDRAKIISFLNKYAARKKSPLSLAVVTGDTVLRSFFPHYSIPHYVWIYKGKVLAMTGPDMLDAGRIEKVLLGQPVSFKMKRDVMDFNENKFLLEDGNGGGLERQLYRSVFTRELEGVRGGTRFVRDSVVQRGMYINFPVVTLYQLALGFDYNRIVLEVKDLFNYAGTAPELYSYELTAPASASKEKLKQFMSMDLDRYLGLQGRMEKRRVDCYVLKRIGKTSEHASSAAGLKKDPGKMDVWENEDRSIIYLRRVPFDVFIRDLNHSFLQWPCKPIIVDETGYKGTISIDLPVEARSNIKQLAKLLLDKGFVLEKAQRVLDVFVLKEN